MLINLRDAAEKLIKFPVVNQDSLKEVRIPKSLAEELKLVILNGKAVINERTSFVPTNEARAASPENYAIFPNQFFLLAINLLPFANELLKYFYYLDFFRSNPDLLLGDSEQIKLKIIESDLKNKFSSDDEIDLFSKFVDNSNDDFRLGAKAPVNIKSGRVLIRSSEDCFGSVILTQINIPNSSSSIFGDLVYSLVKRGDLAKRLSQDLSQINVSYTKSDFCKISKPFILLAGISGTGKSRFVREQATTPECFCSVAVRPDWHEPSDLLGYVSRLSGKSEYHATDVLSFIVKAWCNAFDSTQTTENKLVNANPADMETYWLCLDEMNLAPVEQYFSDYLSVIETREWNGDEYTCAPLLKAEVFSCLEPAELEKLRKSLGIDSVQYGLLWSYFTKNGIPIPPNLIVAGTVNMDETTHGFSRKVIDRALTFDFGKFFPNDFDHYLNPKVRAKSLSFPTFSKVSEADLAAPFFDVNGTKTINFFKQLNDILKDSSFELAFRALNELLISLVCIDPKSEDVLQAVWDDFLMTKVLPRIEGDADKLSVIGTDETILNQLENLFNLSFKEIQLERPDFFRENIDGTDFKIPYRSIAKIKWMQDRLQRNGFTAFWP